MLAWPKKKNQCYSRTAESLIKFLLCDLSVPGGKSFESFVYHEGREDPEHIFGEEIISQFQRSRRLGGEPSEFSSPRMQS